ncbi:MAG: class I SAM-dependent methyltransferase [Pseudomonadota bacterium]
MDGGMHPAQDPDKAQDTATGRREDGREDDGRRDANRDADRHAGQDAGYHAARFTHDPRRDVLWQTLCRHFFAARVPADGCVLDLGAGYGQFVNNIQARRRIALDLWDELPDHVAPGVEAIVGPATDLSPIAPGSVDYAFASNLFEHLTKAALTEVLAQLRDRLTARGTLTLLQPNYRYAYAEYFDDYTHETIFSHVSLADFLSANGFEPVEVRPRFLPLSIKGGLPVHPLLIRAYLLSPIKPIGKQMLVVARPRR